MVYICLIRSKSRQNINIEANEEFNEIIWSQNCLLIFYFFKNISSIISLEDKLN